MTSIEFLASQLGEHIIWEEKIINLIEQAKEMHKAEIIDAYGAGEDNIDNDGCSISRNGKEQYYQETFKN